MIAHKIEEYIIHQDGEYEFKYLTNDAEGLEMEVIDTTENANS